MDEARHREAWHDARPFPHVVQDDLFDDGTLDELMTLLDEESVELAVSDIYAFEATAPEPAHGPTGDAFRALREAWSRGLAPVLARITGHAVTRADMRAFAYRAGHYLLPHTDHRDALGRVLAYIYYLPTPEPPRGGELELYACTVGTDGELDGITSARLVEPLANRLVVFEVGPRSLHQVREVLGGTRLSLAGWFYA